MPIFSGQKKPGSERSPQHGRGATGGKKNTATPPLPAPPTTPTNNGAAPRSAPGRGAVSGPRQELVFHCQLAHGSPTREIKDFSNVKELYARIAASFGLSVDQVCIHTHHTQTHTHKQASSWSFPPGRFHNDTCCAPLQRCFFHHPSHSRVFIYIHISPFSVSY